MQRPTRILVVLPSWVGDTVMATPTLRALRRALPGAFIGGLARPGLAELLEGTAFLDEVHIDRASGMMGPKRVAAKVRVRRYEAAILLTNSFSTALVTRLAGIERRVGYDRDGRGLLLTDRLTAPKRRSVEPFCRSATAPGEWAPVAACAYYFALAQRFLSSVGADAGEMGAMELRVTNAEEASAHAMLDSLVGAGGGGDRLALLNPGGNNSAKRWPAERFAMLASWLVRERGMRVLVSGSPGEAELTSRIVSLLPGTARERVHDLASAMGCSGAAGGLGTLKGVIARCGLMVTNDTGPRHIAAALGVPVVTLFGPTDHRWTTIPFDRERIVLADPTLPDEEVANDHPERCSIDRIEVERVMRAVEAVLIS